MKAQCGSIPEQLTASAGAHLNSVQLSNAAVGEFIYSLHLINMGKSTICFWGRMLAFLNYDWNKTPMKQRVDS